MTGKIAVKIAILAALLVNISSGQTVSCNCSWLQTNIITISNLNATHSNTSEFQISSINLETYYIPTYVESICGSLEPAFVELGSSTQSQKSTKKANRKRMSTFTPSSTPSFLELTQTVTATDVINALVFDTICINQFGYDTYDDDKFYCQNTLQPYFTGTYFPHIGSVDNPTDRKNYINAAKID